MSELKVYVKPIKTNMFGKMIVGQSYYLKSEADKVIAELKKKIEEQKRLRNMALASVPNALKVAKIIQHNKHKRCLAMAEWCEVTAMWCYQAANTLPIGFRATLYGKPVMIEPSRLFKRSARLDNWVYRWRKLAEKFKPNKSTAQ